MPEPELRDGLSRGAGFGNTLNPEARIHYGVEPNRQGTTEQRYTERPKPGFISLAR